MAWVFVSEVAEGEGRDSPNLVSLFIETLEAMFQVHGAELCEDMDGIRIGLLEKSKLGTERVCDSWEGSLNSQRGYGTLENGITFSTGHWTLVESAADGHKLRVNDLFGA